MATDMATGNLMKNRITNDIYRTKLFKSPYSSRCVDYVNPLAAKHSFPSCMFRIHMKQYQKYPWDIPIPTTSNISRMVLDRKIADVCHQTYGSIRMCSQTYYQCKDRVEYRQLLIFFHPKHRLWASSFPRLVSSTFWFLFVTSSVYGWV